MSHSDLRVFVYGTLKPGGHYWPEFCQGKLSAEPLPAKIKGSLYDLGIGYPGLLLNSDQWVQGFILEFATESDFLRLDYLEGYAPDRPESENEYNRLKVPCFSPEDKVIGAVWAYEMTARTSARYQGILIEDGNWPVNTSA